MELLTCKLANIKADILGYNDTERLNKYKEKILNLPKIINLHNWCSEKVDSYFSDIVERYTAAMHMDENEDPTVDCVCTWLREKIDEYVPTAKVKFPIVVFEDGCAYHIFDTMQEIINVLSFVCADFNRWFDRNVNETGAVVPSIKILSENTERQFRDLINHIYGTDECDTNYDIPEIVYRRYTTWDLRWPPKEAFPITADFRTPKVFKHIYEESKNEMMICAFDTAAKSVLQAACVIVERYCHSGFEKTDCYNRLIKLVGIYLDFFANYYHIRNETIEFITEMACHILDGTTPVVNKIWGFDDLCDFGEYPQSANHSRRIDDLDVVGPMVSNESYQAFRAREAIDGSFNFGKSQLKSNSFNPQNFAVNNTENKYKAKFSKLNNIWNDVFHVKPGKLKAKLNSMYFKKWYGRIPSMYSHYGAEAQITENRMKDDPTNVLANTCPKYMTAIVTQTNKVFQELIDLSRRVAAANDINAKINVAKSYCKDYTIEDTRDPKQVETAITNEAALRIARCLFQGNEVYGYTPEGIVENGKFPDANHIVVSLFEDNAHEEPQPLSVNEIFRSPDSITVFAHPQKIAAFDTLFKKCANAITQNFNEKLVSSVHENMEINFKNYSNSLRRKSDDIDGGDANEATLNKKLAKSIQNGIVKGLDYAIDQKARCIQVTGACYDMLGRVERLAKLAVAAMHKVEVEHGDTRMNTGINNKLRNATNARLNKINQTNSGGRYKENLITYK